MRPPSNISLWKAIFIALIGLAMQGLSRGEDSELPVGFTISYENESMRRDMKVATEFLLTKALAAVGVSVSFNHYESGEETRDALLASQVAASELPGYEFARLEGDDKEQIRGLMIPQRHASPTCRFLLLSSGAKTLEELEGESLRIVSRRNRHMARFWLETVLLERGLKPADEFFAEVIDCEKPNDAVLPTFFGKSMACLVSEDDFAILGELNPQLTRKLVKVNVSGALVPIVFALRRDAKGISFEEAQAAAIRMHESSEGRQAFTLLQLTRFSAYDEESLQPTRDLVARAKLVKGHPMLP